VNGEVLCEKAVSRCHLVNKRRYERTATTGGRRGGGAGKEERFQELLE